MTNNPHRLPRHHDEWPPFPRLWEAFANEPKIIDILDNHGLTFDALANASKTFAMRGIDEARKYITSLHGNIRNAHDIGKPAPPKPPLTKPTAAEVQDVVDNLKSPARPASAELKELIRLQTMGDDED